jgi:GntR family transcriptional regulator / MocR family aminotransferase
LLDALAFDLKPRSEEPLYRQLYSRLLSEIRTGAIKPGERLPPTRELAHSLNVSRNTVLLVFEQLTAEGYLEGRAGAGTFVSLQLPLEARFAAPSSRVNPAVEGAANLDRSHSFIRFAGVPETFVRMRRPQPFRINFPALDAFPIRLWAKQAARMYRRFDTEAASHLLGEGDPQGYLPLRDQIARHVGRSRGIECSPENVVIFAGAQQAVDAVCRLLLVPDDFAWCEDPGYDGAYAAVTAVSAIPYPVPVDCNGIIVAAGIDGCPGARLAFVCPSKQFPLGAVMSMERRWELLNWAQDTGSWILEDDYDSEFRYSGSPLPALRALDRSDRVIYVGTFSKTLFPALRLGFAIVPDALVKLLVAARTIVGRYSPIMEQMLVANFMAEDHFAAHIRKMRKLYAARQKCLLDSIRRDLIEYMQPEPTETGMEILATLTPGLDAMQLARIAANEGLEILPISLFSHKNKLDGRISLGFSAFTVQQIEDGVRTLKSVFEHIADGIAT